MITAYISNSRVSFVKLSDVMSVWFLFLWQVGGFFPVIPVSSINKTDSHNLTVILLKMAVTP
jgi:hypothetical protein